ERSASMGDSRWCETVPGCRGPCRTSHPHHPLPAWSSHGRRPVDLALLHGVPTRWTLRGRLRGLAYRWPPRLRLPRLRDLLAHVVITMARFAAARAWAAWGPAGDFRCTTLSTGSAHVWKESVHRL